MWQSFRWGKTQFSEKKGKWQRDEERRWQDEEEEEEEEKEREKKERKFSFHVLREGYIFPLRSLWQLSDIILHSVYCCWLGSEQQASTNNT